MLEVFRAPANLADDLIAFFAKQECRELTQLGEFRRELEQYVGVYALYYRGEHPLYNCVSRANREWCCLPIYVGKAAPGGRRTGRTTGGQNLYSCLSEHRRSIASTQNIKVGEFMFKVVAMEVDLVSWGEAVLIRHFRPVWNKLIDGFGIHDPGSGRAQQRRSVWDVLHPGRTFTHRLPNVAEVDENTLKKRVEEHCQAIGSELGCF